MAYLIEFSRLAEAETLEAFAWRYERDAKAASLWYKDLGEAIRSLEDFPKRCALAPEDDSFDEELRQLLYGKRPSVYRIIFSIRGVTVFVHSVRHSSQRFLTPEGEASEEEPAG